MGRAWLLREREGRKTREKYRSQIAVHLGERGVDRSRVVGGT